MFKLSFFAGALTASATLTDLTADTFDQFIADNDRVLVKFYAPWCGHCKAMASDYKEAAEELVGKIALADVDATVESALAQKYEVGGFPTLKYFVKGKMSEYDYGRKKADILEWADMITSPAVSTDKPTEPSGKAYAILYASELSTAFEEFAEANRKVAKFFHVQSNENKITIQHPNEEINELTALDADSIAKFLEENKMPLVGELNGETFQQYTQSGKGLIWSLFPMEEGQVAEKAKENAAIMQAIAKQVKGRFTVTYTDTHEFKQAIEGMLGVTEFPAFVVQKKAGDKQKFVYEATPADLSASCSTQDGALSEADKIVKFINDVESGAVKAILKSEEAPAEQGPVKVVTGNTLKEMVFSATKDVLFEVYAPWCGHCKKLEPEYEKLAQKVERDVPELVTIAKMDGTANDSPVESIEWTGFPHIVFIKAGSEEVAKYEGDRDAPGMWKYIKENGANKDKIVEALSAKYSSEDEHDEL